MKLTKTFQNSVTAQKKIAEKGYNFVLSHYIEFVNRDETVDFDTSMKSLQKELGDLFRQEEESKKKTRSHGLPQSAFSR